MNEKRVVKKETVKESVEDKPNMDDQELMFTDTTSVNIITQIVGSDEGELLQSKDLYEETKKFIDDKVVYKGAEADKKLEDSKDLLKKVIKAFNASSSAVDATRVKYVIMIGEALLRTKEISKESTHHFGKYAAKHLGFIPERSRQRYMQLARRKDAHPYGIVGVEKLIFLIRVTEKMKQSSDDPIGDLFQKYGMTFDP